MLKQQREMRNDPLLPWLQFPPQSHVLMGRDKKAEAHTEHYTKMIRGMMETEARRSLSPTAQALYARTKQ